MIAGNRFVVPTRDDLPYLVEDLRPGDYAIVVETAEQLVWNGTRWIGGWETYVPRIEQTSVGIPITVQLAEYQFDGPMVDLNVCFSVVGTGTAPASVLLRLPVAHHQPVGPNTAIGSGLVYDASTTRRYVVSVEPLQTSTAARALLDPYLVEFFADQPSGPSGWGVYPNAAIGSGDAIRVSCRYRWR